MVNRAAVPGLESSPLQAREGAVLMRWLSPNERPLKVYHGSHLIGLKILRDQVVAILDHLESIKSCSNI